MNAVSSTLFKTIQELQSLKGLKHFALAGGTNLALRFNHRKSLDVDLFCKSIIGFNGFEAIKKELSRFYNNEKISFQDPMNINDQFTFLRFYIPKDGFFIKVELIQNMKTLDEVEFFKGLRLLSMRDIGLFKLMSTSNRPAKKDIYDLSYITEKIPLIELYGDLIVKNKKFGKNEHRNIFDIDRQRDVLRNPLSLLHFDRQSKHQNDSSLPSSGDNIIQMKNAISWQKAKLNWRLQVRKLCEHLDINFPSAENF